jgi:hypothetical protein
LKPIAHLTRGRLFKLLDSFIVDELRRRNTLEDLRPFIPRARRVYRAAFGRNRRSGFHSPAVAGRLKKGCGNFLLCPSARHGAINRKSAIPAIPGQAVIAEVLRKTPGVSEIVLHTKGVIRIVRPS